MTHNVYLVNDPVAGPTHAERSRNDSSIHFESMGLKKSDPAPTFDLVFDDSIKDKYDPNKTTKAVIDDVKRIVTFSSEKNGEFQRVKIKLIKAKNNKVVTHPEEGYKYTVVMGGKEWDPRVVPR